MMKVKLILSLDQLEKAYKEYKKPFVFLGYSLVFIKK